jgi:hypothetical protein
VLHNWHFICGNAANYSSSQIVIIINMRERKGKHHTLYLNIYVYTYIFCCCWSELYLLGYNAIYSPSKIIWCFGGTCHQRLRMSQVRYLHEAGRKQSLLHAWRRQHVPLKCLLTFRLLHCVTSQKIELFITTAARNSNPM